LKEIAEVMRITDNWERADVLFSLARFEKRTHAGIAPADFPVHHHL
jgi:hypothetical protein